MDVSQHHHKLGLIGCCMKRRSNNPGIIQTTTSTGMYSTHAPTTNIVAMQVGRPL